MFTTEEQNVCLERQRLGGREECSGGMERGEIGRKVKGREEKEKKREVTETNKDIRTWI